MSIARKPYSFVIFQEGGGGGADQWSYMYIISQFTVKTQTSSHICAVSPEPL